MRQNLLRVSLIGVLLCIALSASAQTVYITRTGAKYHRDNCRYLHSSKIRTTLADAKLSYTACSVCRPPTVVEDAEEEVEAASSQAPASAAPAVKPKPAGTSTTVRSRQCTATTKAGTRCKRTTSSSGGKCWQHE